MKKLDEASRNELLYMVKSQHGDRYNRASGYKGFSVQNIDTTNLLKSNTLVVVCRVGDHNTVVELEDVLYWIEMSAEYNNQNQINTKGITQALMNSIDGMDIKVDCDCGDWVYRFSNMATILGYKYGKQEYRPNRYKRTNNQHHGSMCFDGNTLVATETGFKPIKDIIVGDKVFTHTGRLQKVTETMKRQADNVIKLHIGTQDIITTKNHPFYICSGKGKNFRFENAEKLKESSDYLSTSPILQLSSEKNDITKNQAFLLGYYLANGNIGYRSDMDKPTLTSGVTLSINAIYKGIYEKLLLDMGYDTTYHQSNGNSAMLYVKSNELRDFLVKYGGFNYKELSEKYIDKSVLNWSVENKLALIQGFFAGDGQYGSSANYLNMRFLNTNKSIIENLYLILRSLGIHAKCCKFSRKPRIIGNNPKISNAKDMYCITVTGNDINLLDDEWLHTVKGALSSSYKPSTYTSRKFENLGTTYFVNKIKSIEELPPQEVFNIAVENDDSYLITYDMIAVHNCKHLTAILSNKRWLQQVTSTVMDWIEKNIDKVNKFLNRKQEEELTLPNELARQNAKKSWQNRRARQEEPVEEPDRTTDINDIENTEDNVDNKLPQNVQGNNPSTNKVNGLDNGENDEEN